MPVGTAHHPGYLRAPRIRVPPSKDEPTAAALGPFEPWDFEALADGRCRSAEYNDHRLRARRRLLAMAKEVAKRSKAADLPLEPRTSIHNPHQFNGNRVSRLWAYLVRPKAAKTKLKRVLGADLAKDLDQAYKNLYLCIAVEHGALEVSLRIHPDAWYDGQNLVRRTKAEGPEGWLQVLNTLDGFRLGLADWKGEWRCGSLTLEQVEEYLRHYTPGEHQLVLERRWPVPTDPAAREAVLSEEVPGILMDEVLRLVPAFRYMAWSSESDYLFGG